MKNEKARRIVSALSVNPETPAEVITAGNAAFGFQVVSVSAPAWEVAPLLRRFRGIYVESRTAWGCWVWDASEYSETQSRYAAAQIVHDRFWDVQHALKIDAGTAAVFRALRKYARAVSDYCDVYGNGPTHCDGSNYRDDYNHTARQVESYISACSRSA